MADASYQRGHAGSAFESGLAERFGSPVRGLPINTMNGSSFMGAGTEEKAKLGGRGGEGSREACKCASASQKDSGNGDCGNEAADLTNGPERWSYRQNRAVHGNEEHARSCGGEDGVFGEGGTDQRVAE